MSEKNNSNDEKLANNKSYFLKSGIRKIGINFSEDSIHHLNLMWKSHMREIEPYPNSKFRERGIVICAGGVDYFTCAWIAIKRLRSLGCTLPIEVWFLNGELSPEVIKMLEGLNVECKNFLDYQPTQLNGVQLKPLGIILSRFQEVLFIDADNNCLTNPTFLFDSVEYKKFGAIFWPDYWKTTPSNPIWKIVESQDYLTFEQESGQILIDKKKCWKELNLCLYFNQNHNIYGELLHGDKDTFKFAWLALQSKFQMIATEVATCGYYNDNDKFVGQTMVQHDLNGNILFLHRNLLKWSKTKTGQKVWKKVRSFKPNAELKEYSITGRTMNIEGDVIEFDVPHEIESMEEQCLNFHRELKKEPSYVRFIIAQFFQK